MIGLRIKNRKNSIIIIFFICVGISFPLVLGQGVLLSNEADEILSQIPDFNENYNQQESIPDWKNQKTQSDQNGNGIDDQLEERIQEAVGIESSRKTEKKILINNIFRMQNRNNEKLSLDNIPVIVLFPEGDAGSSIMNFKTFGGSIKSTYDTTINGFAGRINQDGLYEFCESLEKDKISFFVQEDRIYQAQLYYAGRNMNLRPYVWNTLSYDGDEYSSIAVVDTGVDDSHNFFSPGYSAGDFSYKIVGWRDEINALSNPYDDNGHGSHCSGIAAGNGSPNYDGSGRTVATAAYNFNYTGVDLPAQSLMINWTRFNVTDPGLIELNCEFDDFTPGPDDADFWAYLYYENTLVDSHEVNTDSWSHTLSYTATSGTLGLYSWRFVLTLIDNTADGYVTDFDMRFRSEIHWPFDPPQFSAGDPWKGVAPDARLVGVKVLDEHGSGWSSDIIDGINWIITNKNTYNITTISLSLGGPAGDIAFINAVNNAVDNGIVTVVSAGNDGPGFNNVGSPGDADNVITVAAMSIDDEITDYSSQGGPSYTGSAIKPDITAPGGSFNNLQMFSTDTNDNDGETVYPVDGYANDMEGAQGTSMSTPAVAGAANLLIEAMGGHESWGYTATEAKRVKALMLMSATETYPLLREGFTTLYSPELNRGGKDIHEGYGRLNIDMAIEAYTQELTLGSQTNAMIKSSLIDSFAKHGLGCHVNLLSGNPYVFTLDVPGGADFDLHLYSDNPSSIGEPVLVASSTSAGLGTDEVISYTATTTGKYYLIAKAISGQGNAIISYPILLHELAVDMEVPSSPDIGNSYLVNATVTNIGTNDETGVDLFLYLDSILVNSTTIPSLLAGASAKISYMWTPSLFKTYNLTAYSPPISGETIFVNNIVTKLLKISFLRNYTMVSGYPYAWVDASGGTELVLSDDDYEAIALPFDFDFYNATFSTVYLCSNGYLSFTDPNPTEYYNVPFPSDYITDYYMVAPFWDDLDVSYSGNVYVQSFGSYWVAEWLNVYHFDEYLVGSFEVILYETGEIVFNYDYLDYMDVYTCGVNLGVDTQYYNTYLGLNDLTDDFSILFSYTGGDTLSITSPDSSSRWETETSHYIYWNSFGKTSNVKLELYNNDIFELEITPNTANDGEYYWTIPSGLTDSDQYQIKITNTTDSSIFDYSDYFVVFNPYISVYNPDSSSTWVKNSSYYIHWISGGTILNVKIELYNNDLFEMEISPSTADDGTYNWTIPYSLADSDQYQIKITDTSDPAVFDFSDYFEITTATITITTPSSSTSWYRGSSQNIYWTSTGTISTVKIELYNNNLYVSEINPNTANDGEYYWTVPSSIAESDQYQIKITDTSNSAIFDFSDYFEIKIPSSGGPGGIPGYNFYLILAVLGILSIALAKRRIRRV